MNARPAVRIRSLGRRLIGGGMAAAGATILSGVAIAIYRGAEILIILGIPIMMLIAWLGLCLVLMGIAYAVARP